MGARLSGRRTRYLGGAGLSLLLVVAAFVAILGGTGGATASIQPNCAGKLGLDKNTFAGPRGVTYEFKCNVDIQAFSVTSTKRMDYFRPNADSFLPDGEAAAEDKFDCGGPFPGWGFGCAGQGTAGNTVSSEFATIKPPCNPAVRVWVSITFQNLNAAEEPITDQTHPFALKSPGGCPKVS
jgi:hypothetical protein